MGSQGPFLTSSVFGLVIPDTKVKTQGLPPRSQADRARCDCSLSVSFEQKTFSKPPSKNVLRAPFSLCHPRTLASVTDAWSYITKTRTNGGAALGGDPYGVAGSGGGGESHCGAVAVAEAKAGPLAGGLTASGQWTPAPGGGIASAREGCRGGCSCELLPSTPSGAGGECPGLPGMRGPRGAPGGPLRISALSEVQPKLRFLERSPRALLVPSLV